MAAQWVILVLLPLSFQAVAAGGEFDSQKPSVFEADKVFFGSWISDAAGDAERRFVIKNGVIQWGPGQKSRITEATRGGFRTDIEGLGPDLHFRADWDGKHLKWNNGDVWRRADLNAIAEPDASTDGREDGIIEPVEPKDDAIHEFVPDEPIEEQTDIIHEQPAKPNEKDPEKSTGEDASTDGREDGIIEPVEPKDDAIHEFVLEEPIEEQADITHEKDPETSTGEGGRDSSSGLEISEPSPNGGVSAEDETETHTTSEKRDILIEGTPPETTAIFAAPVAETMSPMFLTTVPVLKTSTSEATTSEEPPLHEEYLEGLWKTESESGDVTVYALSDGKLRGGGLEPIPLKVVRGFTVEAQFLNGSRTGILEESGELHWDGSGQSWKRLSSLGSKLILDGIWTAKDNPGFDIYRISDGKVSGIGSNTSKISLRDSDGHIVTVVERKVAVAVLQDGEIKWSEPDNFPTWIRASAEHVLGAMQGLFVDKSTKHIYTLAGSEIKGNTLLSQLTAKSDGSLSTTFGVVPASGSWRRGTIEWQSAGTSWRQLSTEEAVKYLDGLWTAKSQPATRVYSIKGGHVKGDGLEIATINISSTGNIKLSPLLEVDAMPVEGFMQDGDIYWLSDLGIWTPLHAEVAQKRLDGLWTAKEDPGSAIYTVSDGKVEAHATGLANLSLDSDGNVIFESGKNSTEGQFTSGEIKWAGTGGTWHRLSEGAAEIALDGLWTDRSAPGEQVYSIWKGRAHGTDVNATNVKVSKDLSIVTGWEKGPFAGVFQDDTIHWNTGRVWMRIPAAAVEVMLNGLWTDKSDPGKVVYSIYQGKLQQGQSQETLSVGSDGIFSVSLSGELRRGILQSQEIRWLHKHEKWMRWTDEEHEVVLGGFWSEEEQQNQKPFSIKSGMVSGPGIGLPAPVSMTAPTEFDAPIGPGGAVAHGTYKDGQIVWSGMDPTGKIVLWSRKANFLLPDVEEEMKSISLQIARPVRDAKKCAMPSISWTPLDMPGHMVSIEPNISECMRRCGRVTECFHYSYWEAGKLCHVHDAFATMVYDSFGYVSGPPGCRQKGGRNANTSVIVLSGDVCYFKESTYLMADVRKRGEEALPRVAVSALKCQQRCFDTQWCSHFSFDIISELCYLAEHGATRNIMINHVAGPKTCPGDVTYTITVSGINYTEVVKTERRQEHFKDAVKYGISHFRETARNMRLEDDEISEFGDEVFDHGEITVESDLDEPYRESPIHLAPCREDDACVIIEVTIGSPHDVPMESIQKLLTKRKAELEYSILYAIKRRFDRFKGFIVNVITIKNSHMLMDGPDTNGQEPCKESPFGWTDLEGDTCANYAKFGLCTKDRGYGAGWETDWGFFQDFATHGRSAVEVCCECGGGTSNDPFPRPLDKTNNVSTMASSERKVLDDIFNQSNTEGEILDIRKYNSLAVPDVVPIASGNVFGAFVVLASAFACLASKQSMRACTRGRFSRRGAESIEECLSAPVVEDFYGARGPSLQVFTFEGSVERDVWNQECEEWGPLHVYEC